MGNLASCVSPKVISITPNRNLISPKVTKITFGNKERLFSNKVPLLRNNPRLWGNNLGY